MTSSAVTSAQRLIRRLAVTGITPEDDEQERLDKTVTTLSTCLITALSTVWVVTYLSSGLPVAAAIPLVYQVISIGSLVAFSRTKRLRFFRVSQLAMMLMLPFFLQLSLGGFVPSSAVVLWSFTAPIAALMFSGARDSINWFGAYAVVLVLSGLVDPLLEPTSKIPTSVMISFFVLNLAGVSATAFLLLRFFVLEREHERAKSERLLLNVLPASVAARLRDSEGTIADGFDDVTVLFADIVDFTTLSAAAQPEEIVELLNGLFSWFDRLAERHGLEKIKTIGDAYMVAGGIPVPRSDHAEAIADMALEMMAGPDAIDHQLGSPVQLRIGIDTGPAVAGVIGVRRFIYDLWGDTVNTASRMESNGLPGSIQVTERTYRRLRGRYALEERGMVVVKGKGDMKTWLLEGRLVG
ncbi:MAG: adenylate/guanylate cyclase domain-containing protein [Actinomycetota bacterium]